MKLVYTGPALRDLAQLRNGIAEHNPNAARRMILRLKQTLLQLLNFPLLGIAVGETPEIRDRIINTYIVRYRVDTKKRIIYILRIWHGREDER